MIIVPEHWYGLPTNQDYFKHAACTVTKTEDARFYDSTAQNGGAHFHDDAICTVDCLMPNKNAILQVIPFLSMDQKVKDCPAHNPPPDPGGRPPPPISCQQALIENATNNTFVGITYFCGDAGFTNIQAGNWQARVHIWDITWSPQSVHLSSDMNDPDTSTLYLPLSGSTIYQGSLYAFEDQRLIDWRNQYTAAKGTIFSLDSINEILLGCSYSGPQLLSLQVQQDTLVKCRQVYSTALGTTIVGPLGPIPVVPVDQDRKPSMYTACQYVYDMSDDIGCPMIDDMCQKLTGIWRYSLAPGLSNVADRIAALPKHLCQNFADPSITGNPWVTPPVGIPDPTNQYFGGLGIQPQPNFLIATLQPQSYAAYIYRSCALQKYTSSPVNCCANDFADGDGNSIFNPLVGQSPPVDPNLPPGYHRTPLIGYPYETSGTPWYKSCFDSSGLTCDPQFRDITSNACGIFMQPHCATNPETSLPASWDISAAAGSQECTRWLGRLLYGPGGNWIQFLSAVSVRGATRDLAGTQLTREILNEITQNFGKVFTMQQIADGKLTELGKVMEPVIFSLYQNYNLNLYDNGVLLTQCGVYTVDQVASNPILRRWCGCMLNSVSYSSRYPGISTACTPTCNSSDVIQYGAPCQGTICILDDITVTLIDSSIPGSVSIVQVCQSCGQIYSSDTQDVRQTCDCRIGNIGITAIDTVLGTVSVSELCGLDGNGGKKAAASTTPAAARAVHALGTVTQTFPYTVVGLLVIVGVLALIAFLVARGMKHGMPYLWARGLAVGLLIIAAIIVAAIAYVVTMMTIG